MPKISILIFLLELYMGIGINLIGSIENVSSSYNFISILKYLLLISSLLSLILGTIVGLAQSKIKRLLAYSTIGHIGFLLLALAIKTDKSIESFIFYLIQYSITNLNTFLILLAFGYICYNNINKNWINGIAKLNKEKIRILLRKNNTDIRYISELKGQFFSNPLLSLSLAICLFSMAGKLIALLAFLF